jgi:multidrug efflux pump subunit AcrA (membrane-fusion protein)
MSRVVKIAVVILIMAAAAAIWFVNRHETEQITASVAVPVRIEQAKKETLRNELRLTSWIDGSGTVTVLPKVSGTLTELNTEVGQRVSLPLPLSRPV